MIGAIAGDIIGSRFEGQPIKSTAFELCHNDCHFTDDTVLTVAVAQAILTAQDFTECIQRWARRYPHAGYGGSFYGWIWSHHPQPYGSWGNGAAMRVSPVGWACDTIEDVIHSAGQSASVTHNHPEGVKGAQAVALAVFLARTGSSKKEIQDRISARFGYDLQRTTGQIRPAYVFDVSCQGSVPEAIICFLEAKNYEEAVRLAISLGGDSDTQACIAGAIAEAYFGQVNDRLIDFVRDKLPTDIWNVVSDFTLRFPTLLGA